ncbi:UNVERIFIED_CONTAM: hypothetical protein Scaly_0116500 [Sesamum calycinum]|uniref:Uncharacterized protein n=1 Tax=Sesamum calycinum TaxID=2727403 RepID=A0AAW2SVK4_9LAMI
MMECQEVVSPRASRHRAAGPRPARGTELGSGHNLELESASRRCLEMVRHGAGLEAPPQKKNMDSSQSISHKAGQVQGQAQEKGSQMMEKAGNAAQSAKESMQQAGEQMQAKAQGAVDAVKDAINK